MSMGFVHIFSTDDKIYIYRIYQQQQLVEFSQIRMRYTYLAEFDVYVFFS